MSKQLISIVTTSCKQLITSRKTELHLLAKPGTASADRSSTSEGWASSILAAALRPAISLPEVHFSLNSSLQSRRSIQCDDKIDYETQNLHQRKCGHSLTGRPAAYRE